MPKLSAITGTTKRLFVESALFQVKICIDYYPGKFTPEYEEEVEAMIRSAIESQSIQLPNPEASQDEVPRVDPMNPPRQVVNHAAQMLTGLVAGWDITDDDGKNLDINVANLVKIPYPLLYAMFGGIKEDMLGKKASSSS